MNTTLNFTEGEITIYCAHDARGCVESSLVQAAELGKRESTLLINTAFTNRKFLASLREHAPVQNFSYQNVQMGELRSSLQSVIQYIKEHKIKYLIINAWEFAFNSYQDKQDAIFSLMNLVCKMNGELSVLVYSHVNPEKVQAGKIQRGTLGKLSGLADAILKVPGYDKHEESEEISEQKTKKNHIPILRNKILVDKEINHLDYARSKMPVTEGTISVAMEKVRVEREDLVMV